MVKRLLFLAGLILSCSTGAFAWTCPSGQHNVEVAKGTPGARLIEGLYFTCQPITPPTPSTPGSNSNAASNSTSSANSSSNSSATGGNATATAQGGKASATQQQGQQQQQTAQGGTANATNGGQQNAQDVNVSNVTNVPRQVASAIAPETLPTSPCFKTYSGAGQGPGFGVSIGGGKVDKGCDDRETARLFAVAGNRVAFAKVMCQTPAAKRAKLTMEDCLASAPVQANTAVPAQAFTAPPPVVIVPVPVMPQQQETPQPAPQQYVPGNDPIQHTGGLLNDFGTCKLVNGKPTNACLRKLDDAVRVLEEVPNARLILLGPLDGGKVLPYLQGKVSRDRIELHFSDDQNTTLTVQTWAAAS